MKTKESDLTQKYLKECFDYDPEGYLVWKVRPVRHFDEEINSRRFNTRYANTRAGYFNKRTDSMQEGFGYYRIGLTRKGSTVGHFKMHRLIWCWHYGYFPELVDHEDNDTRNNKINNLREGDVKKNSYNLKIPMNNSSGYKGVTHRSCPKRRRIPWHASIEFNGYTFSLGSYSTKEEAACAYNIAAKLLFDTFSNCNDTPFKEEDFVWQGKFFKTTYRQIENGTFDWSSRKQRKGSKKG